MKRLAMLTAVALALTGCATQEQVTPEASPSAKEWAEGITNAWYPLVPGTTWNYKGSEEGAPLREVFTVLSRKKVIDGVSTTVVSDLLYEDGELKERTEDWFAQDAEGNVWYFGEDTAEIEDGEVKTTKGSWRAGRDGAKPGIFMPADPKVGDTGYQETLKGEAEDQFEILSLSHKVRTPAVDSDRAMLVKEWTEAEPGVLDHKIYVKNVGLVREETIKGGDENLVLQSVKHPS